MEPDNVSTDHDNEQPDSPSPVDEMKVLDNSLPQQTVSDDSPPSSPVLDSDQSVNKETISNSSSPSSPLPPSSDTSSQASEDDYEEAPGEPIVFPHKDLANSSLFPLLNDVRIPEDKKDTAINIEQVIQETLNKKKYSILQGYKDQTKIVSSKLLELRRTFMESGPIRFNFTSPQQMFLNQYRDGGDIVKYAFKYERKFPRNYTNFINTIESPRWNQLLETYSKYENDNTPQNYLEFIRYYVNLMR